MQFAKQILLKLYPTSGAEKGNRTPDLILTMDVLCQLSYLGVIKLFEFYTLSLLVANSDNCDIVTHTPNKMYVLISRIR